MNKKIDILKEEIEHWKNSGVRCNGLITQLKNELKIEQIVQDNKTLEESRIKCLDCKYIGESINSHICTDCVAVGGTENNFKPLKKELHCYNCRYLKYRAESDVCKYCNVLHVDGTINNYVEKQ